MINNVLEIDNESGTRIPASGTRLSENGEYGERMSSLMTMWPLYNLRNKTTLSGYAGFELGVNLIVFIMEKMLLNEVCTKGFARDFLKECIPLFADKDADVVQTDIPALAEKLLDELSNEGRPFQYDYRNEDGSSSHIKFYLIQERPYSFEGVDTTELTLSREALDILFKSREIYRDLHFSVMQFYLEQQIRRGTFDGALDTVRQLGVAVDEMEKEVEKLRNNIRRNVVEAVIGPDFNKIINKMITQLQKESETFHNLNRLVQEARANSDTGVIASRNKKHMDIFKLERQLHIVSQQHQVLLNKHMDLGFLTEDCLRASLRNALTVRFHMEKEFLAEVIRNNPPASVLLRTAVQPLLKPVPAKIFSLSRFLGPQNMLGREREYPPEQGMDELDEEALRIQEEHERALTDETLGALEMSFKTILNPLLEKPQVRLGEIIADLDGWKDHQVWSFFSLMLILHQNGEPIDISMHWEHAPSDSDLFDLALYRTLKNNPELTRPGQLMVASTGQQIELPYGMVLSDMTITAGEKVEL